MIPPLNTMNTVEHHWTLWLLLPGSNYIESGRITKTIVLSELSTTFYRYWQLWYNKQCSWGNRWYQNTLRTLRIGTIMVSWWLLNMVTDNTGKVQVWYCSSGRILLAADNTGQEARQPLSTPHCSGVKNVKNTKTSQLRNQTLQHNKAPHFSAIIELSSRYALNLKHAHCRLYAIQRFSIDWEVTDAFCSWSVTVVLIFVCTLCILSVTQYMLFFIERW